MFHVRYLADTPQREYIWCGDKISSTSQGNCRLLCDIRKKSWTSTIPGKFSTKLVVVGWDGTSNLCYVAEVNSIDWMFFTKQLLRLRKQNPPKVFPPRKFCTEQIIDLLSMDILWLSYSSSKWITNFVNYWNNLGRRYFHQERRGQFTAVTYLSILSVVFFGGSGFPQHKCRLWKCGHQRWPCRWAISVEQRLISNPPIGPWSTAYLPTQRCWRSTIRGRDGGNTQRTNNQSQRLKSPRRPFSIFKHGSNLHQVSSPGTHLQQPTIQIIKKKPTTTARGSKRYRPTLIALSGKIVWTCTCVFSSNSARLLAL